MKSDIFFSLLFFCSVFFLFLRFISPSLPSMAANERPPSNAQDAPVAWYYAAGGGAGPVGPYPEETFRSMAATGTLPRLTPVWSPSAAAEWLPLWQAVEKGYLRASLPADRDQWERRRRRGVEGIESVDGGGGDGDGETDLCSRSKRRRRRRRRRPGSLRGRDLRHREGGSRRNRSSWSSRSSRRRRPDGSSSSSRCFSFLAPSGGALVRRRRRHGLHLGPAPSPLRRV